MAVMYTADKEGKITSHQMGANSKCKYVVGKLFGNEVFTLNRSTAELLNR